MNRLIPFEKLESDYYCGETLRDGGIGADSDDDQSSDDEIQTELRKIAGIPRCSSKKTVEKSDFEKEMDAELDSKMNTHAMTEMAKAFESRKNEVKPSSSNSLKEEGEPAKKIKKSARAVTFSEDVKEEKEDKKEEGKDVPMEEDVLDEGPMNEDDNEDNAIRKMANKRGKEAKELPPEFYDADEDDDNEMWVQSHRRGLQGRPPPSEKINSKKVQLEDGSDAVLSCPGCMTMLTRDCQRHEIYKDQYRAMFVENCVVDETEKLAIEKTGKEKRRERQKRKKQEAALGSSVPPSNEDLFFPVKCSICSTKVAVIDNDEIYHFFNVLAGYS